MAGITSIEIEELREINEKISDKRYFEDNSFILSGNYKNLVRKLYLELDDVNITQYKPNVEDIIAYYMGCIKSGAVDDKYDAFLCASVIKDVLEKVAETNADSSNKYSEDIEDMYSSACNILDDVVRKKVNFSTHTELVIYDSESMIDSIKHHIRASKLYEDVKLIKRYLQLEKKDLQGFRMKFDIPINPNINNPVTIVERIGKELSQIGTALEDVDDGNLVWGYVRSNGLTQKTKLEYMLDIENNDPHYYFEIFTSNANFESAKKGVTYEEVESYFNSIYDKYFISWKLSKDQLLGMIKKEKYPENHNHS